MPSNDPNYQKVYIRKHYQANKEYYKRKAREKHARDMQWFRNFKATLSCSECGESFWACLDFHHREGQDKECEITKMVSRGTARKKVLDEIAKCDVLCANCHRKLHNHAIVSDKPSKLDYRNG